MRGDYDLLAKAGEGASGSVFHARDRSGADAAVKVFSERASDRVRAEIQLLSSLNHSAIPRCLAHGEDDEGTWLALAWVSGPTLAERLRAGPIPARDVIAIGRRLSAALLHAHKRGIAHLDVKPANVILEHALPERAVLVDFGLSTSDDGGGSASGTPGYIAPERLQPSSDGRASADVFGLGCVLFECAHGARAFDGDTPELRQARVLHAATPDCSTLDAPPLFQRTVHAMLLKDPAERPSLRAVMLVLDELASGPSAPAPEGPERPVEPARGRRPQAPLFGRDVELRVLTSLYEASRDSGQSNLALIEAHAGAGKSRLTEALIEWITARSETPEVWTVSADSVLGRAPRSLLRSLLHERLLSATSTDRTSRILGAHVGLLDPASDLEVTDLMSRGAAYDAAVAQELTSWLRRAATRDVGAPLVLVLEDIHHADVESVRLLTRCLPGLADVPLVVIASTRPDHELGAVLLHAGAQRLSLRPLSFKASVRIAEALGHFLSAELSRKVWEQSGGSPLFFEELLRQVGGEERGDAESAQLSASLREAIEGDLARLSSLAVTIVRLASLMGTRVERRDINGALADRDPLSLEVALDELEVRDVLRSPSRDLSARNVLTFRHALWQETAAAHIPLTEQIGFRSRIIAEWRTRDPRAAANQCELLAVAAESQTGDPTAPNVGDTWGEAGLLWLAGRTHDRAAEMFARAVDRAPATWLQPLGETLTFLRRDPSHVADALRRGVEKLGATRAPDALIAVARGFAAIGLGDEARLNLERARVQLDPSNPADHASSTRHLEATIEAGIRRGAFAEAADAWKSLAASGAPAALRTRVFAALALAATGDITLADQAIAGASALPEADDKPLRAEISKYDVLVRIFAREFERGVLAAERAIEDARAAELPFHEAVALHNLGDLLHRLGRFAASREALEASEVISEKFGFRMLRSGNRSHLRYLEGLDGDVTAATDLSTEVATAEAAGALGNAVDSRCLLARLYRATGELARAREEYETIRRTSLVTGQRLALEEAMDALKAL